MLPEHIVEREDRKTLDLLRFALEAAGIPDRAWAIAMTFDELPPCDDCIGLWKEDGSWVVSYAERGAWREMGRFPTSFNAAHYFYAQFRSGPSPYDFRDQWERATGQSFSMVE